MQLRFRFGEYLRHIRVSRSLNQDQGHNSEKLEKAAAYNSKTIAGKLLEVMGI